MKQIIILTSFLGASMAVGAEEGFFLVEYPGYEDTPQIAGSEFKVHQKDRPQPTRVRPGGNGGEVSTPAPSDAVILFDGGSLDAFGETTWQVRDGSIVAGEKALTTKQSFGDCQLHVEWRTPDPARGEPGNMGNSGLFFMQRYELQVFDSYSCKIYADGSAGAIYGQSPPLVNVCRRPGEWQSYDVVFTAAVFEDGKLVKEARITVLHNGVLVQKDTKILGPTHHKQAQPYQAHAARLPLAFQGHNSPVEYRNIWIRDLERTGE